MNNFFSNLLASILKRLSVLTIWRFKPGIIGVTGSVGKTSTKLAIAAVIGSERSVRYGKDNLNNELGLPLAILGDWRQEELDLVSRSTPRGTKTFAKMLFWLRVIGASLFRIAFGSKSAYPEILILEYGADRPGDLKTLIAIARPNISIVTAVGDIPVHVEFYSGPEDVAREKSRLIETLPSAGYAILNYDDTRVMNIKDRTRANIMTFGFHEGAQVRVGGFEHRSDAGEPVGISFKIEYGGSFVPVRLDGVFGKAHAYAAAAAACVGIVFGMNLVKISEALGNYKPPHSRMEIIAGLRGSFVIDDSYNASLLSMQAGLHTLSDLPGKRKVAILGDMLELGAYSMEAHEKIGAMAGKCADILITVGSRAKMISEVVKKGRFAKRNVYEFATVEDAKAPVADLIKKGDLVLVKGSRGVRLDELVEVLRAEPAVTLTGAAAAAGMDGRGVREA
jgi:UDP-N-acetylmuramoyl-tripeptide--D-alanyl-D-alanine ligase